MMLCQRCQELVTSQAKVSGSGCFPHHTCIEGLTTAAEAGCIICATIWSQYTPDEQQKFDLLKGQEFEALRLVYLSDYSCEGSAINLSFDLDPEVAEMTGIRRHVIEFHASKATDEQKSLGHDRRILGPLRFPSSTNSPEVFSLTNKWINNCLKNHPSCSQSTDATWYPTRLLNFKSFEEGNEHVLYLVETNTITPSEPYVTLSHSWGEGHIITLNKQSYQRLLRGIPLSSLPPTFRDACFIASQLGVNYIWIDALCIFQDKDDLSDWSREASLMHKVYLYSHCNIVAAENRNSSESIFRKRNPQDLHPPIAEFTDPDSSDQYILDYLGYRKPVENAHINTRGWVMQERFLSPRALHFGAHQVYWECRECMASETNPDGFEIFGDGAPFKALMDAPHGYVSWTSLVGMYSACALSFPIDKLVAISALARLYASYLSDEYVAGMWYGNLQTELLWLAFGIGEDDEPMRYETYTAPTWSWASIKGSVTMNNYDTDRVEYLYEVDDYKLEYATEDKMGAVRSGWLRLRGHLETLELLPEGKEDRDKWSLIIGNIKYDPRRHTNEEERDIDTSVWLDEPASNFDMENKSGALYCMPARHHPFDEFHRPPTIWDFLLLQKVDNARDTFRRIGVARIMTSNVKNPWPTNRLNQGASSGSAGIDGSDTTALPSTVYEGGVQSIYVI